MINQSIGQTFVFVTFLIGEEIARPRRSTPTPTPAPEMPRSVILLAILFTGKSKAPFKKVVCYLCCYSCAFINSCFCFHCCVSPLAVKSCRRTFLPSLGYLQSPNMPDMMVCSEKDINTPELILWLYWSKLIIFLYWKAVVPTDVWGESRARPESPLSRSFPTGGELTSVNQPFNCVAPAITSLTAHMFAVVLNWSELSLLQLLLRFLQKTFHQEVIMAILQSLLVNLALKTIRHHQSYI